MTQKTSSTGKIYFAFRVTCRMTDKDVLDKLQGILGGKIYGPHNPKNPKHKPHFNWTLGKLRQIIPTLQMLLPFMGSRRKAKITEILGRIEQQMRRPPSHGSRTCYENGCRCVECKAAHAKHHRLRRRKRGAKPFQAALHGTRSKYVSGCRCQPCREAARMYEQSRSKSARLLVTNSKAMSVAGNINN